MFLLSKCMERKGQRVYQWVQRLHCQCIFETPYLSSTALHVLISYVLWLGSVGPTRKDGRHVTNYKDRL